MSDIENMILCSIIIFVVLLLYFDVYRQSRKMKVSVKKGKSNRFLLIKKYITHNNFIKLLKWICIFTLISSAILSIPLYYNIYIFRNPNILYHLELFFIYSFIITLFFLLLDRLTVLCEKHMIYDKALKTLRKSHGILAVLTAASFFFIIFYRDTQNNLPHLLFFIFIFLLITDFTTGLVFLLDQLNLIEERYSIPCIAIIMTSLLYLFEPNSVTILRIMTAVLVMLSTASYIAIIIHIVENNKLYKHTNNVNIYNKYIIMILFGIVGIISYAMLSCLILYYPNNCESEQIPKIIFNAIFALLPGGKTIIDQSDFRGNLLDIFKCIYRFIFTTAFLGFILKANFKELIYKADDISSCNNIKEENEVSSINMQEENNTQTAIIKSHAPTSNTKLSTQLSKKTKTRRSKRNKNR